MFFLLLFYVQSYLNFYSRKEMKFYGMIEPSFLFKSENYACNSTLPHHSFPLSVVIVAVLTSFAKRFAKDTGAHTKKNDLLPSKTNS